MKSGCLFFSRLREWLAILERILSEEFIRSKVRDCGKNAISQSPGYNFCRCKNMSILSSRQLASFWIRPERNKSWGLYIGGEGILELLGYYGSAFAAADSVYMQSTGWDSWDRRKRIDAPPALLLWSRTLVK